MKTEKAGRKWLKNFLRRHSQISIRTPEGFHSQERGVSLLKQYFSFFKSTNQQWTPFNIILQDFKLRRNRHQNCTAQTHENISTERQASDNFSSIRRTGIPCDSRPLYESSWTLHSSVTCISMKKC